MNEKEKIITEEELRLNLANSESEMQLNKSSKLLYTTQKIASTYCSDGNNGDCNGTYCPETNPPQILDWYPSFIFEESVTVRNRIIHYNFTAFGEGAHENGKDGIYHINLSSTNTPMTVRLYKDGLPVTNIFYGYTVSFNATLKYNGQYEVIVEFDDYCRETTVYSQITYDTWVDNYPGLDQDCYLSFGCEQLGKYGTASRKYIFTANAQSAHKNGGKGRYIIYFSGEYEAKVSLYNMSTKTRVGEKTGRYFHLDVSLEYNKRYYFCITGSALEVGLFNVSVEYVVNESDDCNDYWCSGGIVKCIPFNQDVVEYISNKEVHYRFKTNKPEAHKNGGVGKYTITAKSNNLLYMVLYSSGDNVTRAVTDASQNISIQALLKYNTVYDLTVGISQERTGTVTTHISYYTGNISPDITPCEKVTPSTKDDDTGNRYVQDPVDVYTGAHTIKNDIMNLFGGQKLCFSAMYNSAHLGSNSLGYGWYHNYEKKIVQDECSDDIYVYEKPSQYNRYYGDYCAGEYICIDKGKNGYTLTRTDTGYTLNCNSERKEYYDKNGVLYKIVNKQGFETTISYCDCVTTITDSVTGKSIYLDHNETGKIIQVRDDAGRYAKLTYLNGYLINICDVNNHNLFYTYDENGRVKSGYDDNNVKYFTNTYDNDGRVSTQVDGEDNSASTFVYDGDSRITTDRNGATSTRVFDKFGQLISFTDENGNTVTYTYDKNGNIIKETDSQGNCIKTTYNSFNKPVEKIDKNGNITKYKYDNIGNLSEVLYPNGKCERFTYNDRNQLRRYTDLRDTVTEYFYDDNGYPTTKCIGPKDFMTYVCENGLLMSETDFMGNTTTYCYNEFDQLKRITDCEGNITKYEYDYFGNVLSVTDSLGNVTSYTYDCNYQKISQTDANGNVTKYTYTGNMKPKSVEYANGSVEEYTYDGEDRLISVKNRANDSSDKTYDAAGRLTSVTNEDGYTANYIYDAAGNLVEETNFEGTSTYRTYDAMGNVLTVTDIEGNITRNYYDCMSRLVRSVNHVSGATFYEYSDAGDLLSVTDPLGNKTTYTYDERGNKLSVTDPNGNTTSFTYDANNNMTSKTDALGNTTVYQYDAHNKLVCVTDALDHSVTYGYDPLGRQTTVTDAKGNVTTTAYDAAGNVVSVTDAKGKVISTKTYNSLNLVSSQKDAFGNTTAFVYDSMGRIHKVTDPLNNIKEYGYDACGFNTYVTDSLDGTSIAEHSALGKTTRLEGPLSAYTEYEYDALGRLCCETTTDEYDKQYEYNELGLKKYYRNAKGDIHKFFYDAKGRITGCITPEDSISYTYDANDNILTVTDRHGTTTRIFDELNRVSSVTDAFGNTIGYRYDAVGNLAAVVYPDNTEVTYTYDENNNLLTVTDWNGKVTSYVYDQNNQVVGITRPNNTVNVTVYDDAHRVVSSKDTGLKGTVINGFEYTYDNNGRITTEKDLAKNKKMCYTYDSEGKVIHRVDTDLTDNTSTEESFTYDLAGNITSADNEYDAQNKLITQDGQAIQYDKDGNMLYAYIDGVKTDFTYDSSNRLIRAGDVEYVYNAEDVRIRKTKGESTTEYIYDTNAKLSRLLMLKEDGTVTKFVYGLGLICQYKGTALQFYHFDYRGSTTVTSGKIGSVSSSRRFTYDTYGNITDSTYAKNDIFLFNGRDGVVTDHNGLYYMRARYYCPKIKRFVNADIVSGEISDTVTLNRFAYANGNPVSFVDPFGLSAQRGNINKSINDLSAFFDYLNRLPTDICDYIIKIITGVSKKEHYSRNDYNINFPEQISLEGSENISSRFEILVKDKNSFFYEYDLGETAHCHQFTAEGGANVKVVSKNGIYEAIYDKNGKLVTAPEDVGTYNFVSPKDRFGHTMKDVIPWLFWGNAVDDSTCFYERLDATITGITTDTAKEIAKSINDGIDYFTENYTIPAAKKVAGFIKNIFNF